MLLIEHIYGEANMFDCSAILCLYFAITAFGLEALWLITMRKIIIKKPHCFDFPTSTEVALLGMYTFFCGKNFAIIGACIGYLWTEYCISTMYIFIYLYNINTFHHTIFWLPVVSTIEEVAFECTSCVFSRYFYNCCTWQSSRPNYLLI